MGQSQPWTFAVAGNRRAGVGVVVDALNNRAGVTCHVGLLDGDDAARRAAHEAYFGVAPDGDTAKVPPWFVPGLKSPTQYVTHDVFGTPRRGERAVGVHTAFDVVRGLEMYDLFESLYAAGGFSLVLVVRNPVAAFVSARQAERSGTWAWDGKAPRPAVPSPVRVDAEALTEFCRADAADVLRLRRAVPDVAVVTYADVLRDYQAVMTRVFAFVELPDEPVMARPGRRRLPNRPVPNRVTNWAELRATVPADVRGQMDAEDLI